jgi:hypothetical protein
MRPILIAALLLPLAAFSQKKNLPSFGKIEKDELVSKSCDFDSEAGAMVLYENARRYFDISSGQPYSEMRRHVRVKILTEKGRDNADIHLFYRNRGNESIINITATTHNVDEAGNVVSTKVEKNAIFQKKVNSVVSEVAFTFPDVKPGSIIEYKYVHRNYYYKDWQMQKSIPVKFSRYEIDFPSMFEVHTMPYCSMPYSSTDESSSLRTIKVFSMENVPALRDETYMSSKNDYLQRIESWVTAYYQGGRRWPISRTWPEIAKLMLEDENLGMQLKKSIPRTEDLEMQLKDLKDPYSKMAAIHKYVRSNMRWDGIDNYWASSGVKTAWKEKTGTSGEINLILINLLRDAGLNAKPLMVSTRENGRITTFYSDFDQFNKVLAYVTIGEKKYVLDGTDKTTPSFIIPYDVMFSEGMLLDASVENKFTWVELWDENHQDKNLVYFKADISKDGEMKGHTTVSSSDYAKLKRLPYVADKDKFLNTFIQHTKHNFTVDGLAFKNDKHDSLPLMQDFDFKGPVNSSGEYSFINLNLFSGMATNPFIADERFSDVFFGTKQSQTIICNVKIPDGHMFEELPKNIKMTIEDQSIVVTRMIAATGNTINAKITIEIKKPFYTPEEYDNVKEFYKKMYALLDEQIVFKKNS